MEEGFGPPNSSRQENQGGGVKWPLHFVDSWIRTFVVFVYSVQLGEYTLSMPVCAVCFPFVCAQFL